jgi:hypothetical protein
MRLPFDEIDDIFVDAARAAVAISLVQFVARVSRAEKPLSIGQFMAMVSPFPAKDSLERQLLTPQGRPITEMNERRMRL